MEMGAVMHFLGENIHRIDFTGIVLDCDGFVLDPFANRIFAKLDMSRRLRCHVVRPPDTGVIVIVEESRLLMSVIGKPDFLKLRLRLRKSTTF